MKEHRNILARKYIKKKENEKAHRSLIVGPSETHTASPNKAMLL